MAIEDYYHTITGTHTSVEVDPFGDTVTTEGTPYTFAGYIGKPSSKQAELMAQRGIDIDGRLYAPINAGVAAYDILTDDTGQRYQVVSEPRDVARRGHHVEAALMLLRGASNANSNG